MSDKEKVVQLLDSVPEYKMGYILAYIQGITADEEIEEKYDIALADEAYAEYESDGKKSRPISELWKELDL